MCFRGVGNFEIVKFLLENIEDKNPENDFGETPEDMARSHGNLDVIGLFENINSNESEDTVTWSDSNSNLMTFHTIRNL